MSRWLGAYEIININFLHRVTSAIAADFLIESQTMETLNARPRARTEFNAISLSRARFFLGSL